MVYFIIYIGSKIAIIKRKVVSRSLLPFDKMVDKESNNSNKIENI